MFKLKYEKKVEKFIKNLDFSIKVRIIKELRNLQINPFPRNKKHILETLGSSLLCELAVDKFRIYYIIEDKFVIIEGIGYEGIVNLLEGHSNHKSGNNNYSNQKKDIGILKKWFLKFFRK